MRIKVDEDLPKAVAELLREHGHDVAAVAENRTADFPRVEQGMGG